MGVLLLNRGGNRVSLTAAGSSFLADSKRLLAMSASNVLSAQRLGHGENVQLNIGYIANVHYHLLPATLGAFRSAYPNVALNLFDMTCAEQFRALEEHKIDLGFVGLRESLIGSALRRECVAHYKVLVALPADSRLAKRAWINLKELDSVFFVGLSEVTYPGSRDWLLNLAPRAGFTPKILQDADREPAVLSFVAAGLGVALMPEQVQKLPHDGVVFRPLRPAIRAESCIAWRDDNLSRPLQEYIEIVKRTSGHAAA